MANKYAINRQSYNKGLSIASDVFNITGKMLDTTKTIINDVDEFKTNDANAILQANPEAVVELDSYMAKNYNNKENTPPYTVADISAKTKIDPKIVKAFMYRRAYRGNDTLTWNERQLRAGNMTSEYISSYENIAKARQEIKDKALLLTDGNLEIMDRLDEVAENMNREDLANDFETGDFEKLQKAYMDFIGFNIPLSHLNSWKRTRKYTSEDAKNGVGFTANNIANGKITNGNTWKERKEKRALLKQKEEQEKQAKELEEKAKNDLALADAHQVDIARVQEYMTMLTDRYIAHNKNDEVKFQEVSETLNSAEKLSKGTGVDVKVCQLVIDTGPEWTQENAKDGINYSSAGVGQGKWKAGQSPNDRIRAMLKAESQKLDEENKAREEAQAQQELVDRVAFASEYSQAITNVEEFRNRLSEKYIKAGDPSKFDEMIEIINSPQKLHELTGERLDVCEHAVKYMAKYDKSYAEKGISYSNVGYAQGTFTEKSNPEAVTKAKYNTIANYYNLAINGDSKANIQSLAQRISYEQGDPELYEETIKKELDNIFSLDGDIAQIIKDSGINEQYISDWIDENREKYEKQVLREIQAWKKNGEIALVQRDYNNSMALISADTSFENTTENLVSNINEYNNIAYEAGAYSIQDLDAKSFKTIEDWAYANVVAAYEKDMTMTLEAMNNMYGNLTVQGINKYVESLGALSPSRKGDIDDLTTKTLTEVLSGNTLETYKTKADENTIKLYEKAFEEQLQPALIELQNNGYLINKEHVYNFFGYKDETEVPSFLKDSFEQYFKIANSMNVNTMGGSKLNDYFDQSVLNSAVQRIDENGNYTSQGRWFTYTDSSDYNLEQLENNLKQKEDLIAKTGDEEQLSGIRKKKFNKDGDTIQEEALFLEDSVTESTNKMNVYNQMIDYYADNIASNIAPSSKSEKEDNEYKVGEELKEGKGVYIENSEGFLNLLKENPQLTSSSDVMMTTARMWRDAELRLNEDTVYNNLKNEFAKMTTTAGADVDYSGWVNKVEIAKATSNLSENEYNDLKGLIKLNNDEKLVEGILTDTVNSIFSNIKDSTNVAISEPFKAQVKAQVQTTDFRAKLKDAIRKNNGEVPTDLLNEITEPLKEGIYNEALRNSIVKQMKNFSISGNTVLNKNESVNIQAKNAYKNANDGSLMYAGNEVLTNALNALIARANGQTDIMAEGAFKKDTFLYNLGFGKESKTGAYLLDYYSKAMWGCSYSDLEDIIDNQTDSLNKRKAEYLRDVVIQNALVPLYMMDNYVDICQQANLNPTYGTNVLVNLDDDNLGVMNVRTGEVYYKEGIGTGVTKKKVNPEVFNSNKFKYNQHNILIKMSDLV